MTKRERVDLLEEELDYIRGLADELEADPSLLFWCPRCRLPRSRSGGEWRTCRYHPQRMVTCGVGMRCSRPSERVCEQCSDGAFCSECLEQGIPGRMARRCEAGCGMYVCVYCAVDDKEKGRRECDHCRK